MRVVFSDRAVKQFKKIDFAIQKRIKHFIDELEGLENPRMRGKGLGVIGWGIIARFVKSLKMNWWFC